MKTADLVLLLVSAAIIFASVVWPRIWRALRFPGSANWPTLPATVEQVLVRTYSGRAGTTYRAEITYSYQANGGYYSGHYMGDWCSSEAEVGELFDACPKGTVLQIHVHPRKPALSVLNP